MTVADLIIRLAVDGKGVAKGVNTAMAEFHRIGRAAGNLFAGYFSASTISNQAAKLIQYAGKITDLKGVIEGDDGDLIKEKTDALAQASMKLGEAMYKASQAEAEAKANGTRDEEDDDVVDADFEEVKDDDKK